MTFANRDGVQLLHRLNPGDGPPLVLVHGAWVTHRSWDPVVKGLAESFRVLTYDRRGHGDAPRPQGTVSLEAHTADLAELIERLGLAPAWVTANSSGAVIALRLAMQRPELFRGLIAHEPPLFRLLRADPAAASWLARVERALDTVVARIRAEDPAGAARLFMESVTLGPGAWEQLSPEARRLVTANAKAFLDEAGERDALDLDLQPLRHFTRPVLLTQGGRSPPAFAAVVARLLEAMPKAQLQTFAAAGHLPHRTHPQEFIDSVKAFVEAHERGD